MTSTCIKYCLCALLLLEAANVRAANSTLLLPGLRYYGHAQGLRGRLVFTAANPRARNADLTNSASIYQYDLTNQALKKITDCPDGHLDFSREAELFCVFSADSQNPVARKPFLYADSVKQSRTVQLEKPPEQTLLIGRHAFFLISGEYYLVDFDFDTQRKRFIGFHNASAWGRGHVSQLSDNPEAPGGADTLHFHYYHWEGVTQGPRHESGFYDLDIRSGSIRWSPQQGSLMSGYSFPSTNGQFVYFTGSGSPIHGFRLVTSPWDCDTRALRHDPGGKRTRTLHVFPRPLFSRAPYTLEQISPDRKYALVTHWGPTNDRAFYVVNLENGGVDLLLKDTGALGGPFEPRSVFWLP